MPRTAGTTARNGSPDAIMADFENHAKQIRKDISALADSISDAGGTLAKDAKAGADQKVVEARQISEDTIRELKSQLANVEKQVSDTVRERPVAALAAAAGVGFLIAMLARR